MQLKDRVALVTGAGRERKGIGRAVALELARAGAAVAVASRTLANAESVAAAVQEAGGRSIALGVDVARMDQVESAVKKTLDEFGQLDILVTSAAITRDNLLVRMTEDEWQSVIDTNLTGTFNCTKAVTRTMVRQRYGRIVYISSVVGLQGNKGQVNYAASKAALTGMAKSAARELASRGITVNVVAPGFIETAMTDGLPEQARGGILQQIPAERFGRAEEVASAVLFLCSESAGYITGETLRVDGGMAM